MNVSGFEIGDLVTLPNWHEYLPVVDVDTYKIKVQQNDAVSWYDTRDLKFTKKEVTVNEETKGDAFEIGDIVWCLVYGKGEVISVTDRDDPRFPVLVRFLVGEEITYKQTGEFYYTCKRTLFFSEPKIEASVTRPFVPMLKGKKVLIQYNGGSYFAEPTLITGETLTHISSDEDLWLKKDVQAIYEVSSENLVK